MADIRWIGAALDIADEWTVTFASTWATGDTVSLTIGTSVLTVTVGTLAAVGDVANALSAAINAVNKTDGRLGDETRNVGGREVLELTGIEATAAAGVVTLAHSIPGHPFEVSVSVVTGGSGTGVAANSVVATGKHFANNPVNWQGGALPGADDVMVFDTGVVAMLYGLAHFRSGTTVDSGTTSATTTDKLVDATQNFVTTVAVGDTVFNTTDGTEAVVTAVDSNSTLSIDADIMASGETYTIGSGIETGFRRTTDYGADIGLPPYNALGFYEYRDLALQLYNRTADKDLFFDQGVNDFGLGSTRLDLDGQLHRHLYVNRLSRPREQQILEVSGGSYTLWHARGNVSIDPPHLLPKAAAVFTDANIGAPGLQPDETHLTIGIGTHFTGQSCDITQWSGRVDNFGTLYTDPSNYPDLILQYGVFFHHADSDLGGIGVYTKGRFVWLGAGDAALGLSIFSRGEIDMSRTNKTQTINGAGLINMYAGGILRRKEQVLGEIALVGCEIDDVTLTEAG